MTYFSDKPKGESVRVWRLGFKKLFLLIVGTSIDIISRVQSFTSLMADLRQDINRVSSYSRCAIMEHFIEEIAPL